MPYNVLNQLAVLTTVVVTLMWRPLSVGAVSCVGCVDIDELNFDKTIAHFPYAIVKFDIAFPYGEKHEAFAEFSKTANRASDQLLVATVGIKDYGEMENKQLGQRFAVDDKHFPGILFFKGGVDSFVRFPAHLDVTLDNLKSFVSENSELYIGRDGCIKEFNELAKNYANLAGEEQAKVLLKAESLKEQLTRTEDLASAKAYLTFMRKIKELGYTFVEEETKRLLRLKAGKVTAAKKTELHHKLNILEAFRVTKLAKGETEAAVDVDNSHSDAKLDL